MTAAKSAAKPARKSAPERPFADTARARRPRWSEAKARQAAAQREAYGRLLANDDFREWMFAALYTLCAFEPEVRDTTEFERGVRAGGSYLRRELLRAEGAPQFFADLDRRYWSGVRRGIVEAEKAQAEKARKDNER